MFSLVPFVLSFAFGLAPSAPVVAQPVVALAPASTTVSGTVSNVTTNANGEVIEFTLTNAAGQTAQICMNASHGGDKVIEAAAKDKTKTVKFKAKKHDDKWFVDGSITTS